MKKFLALLLTVMLILPCALVSAEESDAVTADAPAAQTSTEESDAVTVGAPTSQTISAHLELDKEAIKEILPMFGVSQAELLFVDPVLDVISALSEDLILTESGIQFNLNLKDESALSTAFGEVGESIRLVSTLIPDYAISISPEELATIMQSFGPAASDSASQDSESIDSSDIAAMTGIAEPLIPYFERFIDSCVKNAVPGEPEPCKFEYDGIAFDTKVPVTVDTLAIIETEKQLVDEMMKDEDVLALLTPMLLYSGYEDFDPIEFAELNAEIMSAEHIPEVAVDYYTISDDTDTFYMIIDSTDRETHQPYQKTTILQKSDGSGNVVCSQPDVPFTSNFTYGPEGFRLDIDMAGMYMGMAVKMDDTGLMTCDLFFLNPEKPLASLLITFSPEGELTLSLDDESKTIITLQELMTGGSKVENMVADIIFEGLPALIKKVVSAVPSASPLASLFTGF